MNSDEILINLGENSKSFSESGVTSKICKKMLLYLCYVTCFRTSKEYLEEKQPQPSATNIFLVGSLAPELGYLCRSIKNGDTYYH